MYSTSFAPSLFHISSSLLIDRCVWETYGAWRVGSLPRVGMLRLWRVVLLSLPQHLHIYPGNEIHTSMLVSLALWTHNVTQTTDESPHRRHSGGNEILRPCSPDQSTMALNRAPLARIIRYRFARAPCPSPFPTDYASSPSHLRCCLAQSTPHGLYHLGMLLLAALSVLALLAATASARAAYGVGFSLGHRCG